MFAIINIADYDVTVVHTRKKFSDAVKLGIEIAKEQLDENPVTPKEVSNIENYLKTQMLYTGNGWSVWIEKIESSK